MELKPQKRVTINPNFTNLYCIMCHYYLAWTLQSCICFWRWFFQLLQQSVSRKCFSYTPQLQHTSQLQFFHLTKTMLTLLGPHSSTCVSGLWRLLQWQYHRSHFFLMCHFEPTFVANVDLLVQILTFDHLYGSLV